MYRIIMTMCLCLSFVGAKAQDTHWQVDIYAYQYDMTVYFSLTDNGVPIADLSDYEVAAFCGNECRGVSTILIAEKDGIQKQCGYLRIRSNVPQGETISFRLYQKSTQQEIVMRRKCDFEIDALCGTPSEPMLLAKDITLLGDVNGDGDVNADDVTALVNYIIGRGTLANEPAAYVNDDNKIDIADVAALIELIK